MKILALETSAKSVSTAVVENGAPLAYAYQCTGLTHSRTLMPMVDAMLKNAELTLGDLKTAQALTFKYLDLMNALFMDVNPIPVKQALNLMGFNCGHCRLPLADMSDEQIAKLKVEMAKHLQLA